jgi:poly-beta-1,6-N-acetyl-D-glucosamine synthase
MNLLFNFSELSQALQGKEWLVGFGIIAFATALWQTYFYYSRWIRLIRFKSVTPDLNHTPSVSIVICARNERTSLLQNLPHVLAQDYPDFEVVVVNDASWDGTLDVLLEFKETYPHLKMVEVREDIKRIDGKKFPLTMGIKAASNPILLLTDADCKPSSNQWLRHMVSPYADRNIELVLGYSPYQPSGKNLLNFLVRAETSLTAMLYLSMALVRKPYMGVGRNLSYTKELFFRHKGFASHHHLPAGDDDLFVRDAATPQNTAIVIHPASRTLSLPPVSFYKWIRQKKRHLLTGKYYHPNTKRTLGLFSLSHFLFWISMVAGVVTGHVVFETLVIMGARWLLHYPVVFLSFRKLGYPYMGLAMPLLDVLYVPYTIFTALVLLFSKKKSWS